MLQSQWYTSRDGLYWGFCFVFFYWQRPKRPQSLFFFYTHVTRFSVGVCISRQSELLANDLSHSVLRLWFHCYLRALFPPGPHGGKARVPNPSVTISVSNELNWWENLWLVGLLARPSRTTDPYSLRLAPDARGVTTGCWIRGRDTLVQMFALDVVCQLLKYRPFKPSTGVPYRDCQRDQPTNWPFLHLVKRSQISRYQQVNSQVVMHTVGFIFALSHQGVESGFVVSLSFAIDV